MAIDMKWDQKGESEFLVHLLSECGATKTKPQRKTKQKMLTYNFWHLRKKISIWQLDVGEFKYYGIQRKKEKMRS